MTTKIKVEFGFGTGLDCHGYPIPPGQFEKGMQTITASALRLFGGYTRYLTQGGWKDSSDGKVFVENGATISVLVEVGDVSDKVEQLVAVIKMALCQRAVYVCSTTVDCELL